MKIIIFKKLPARIYLILLLLAGILLSFALSFAPGLVEKFYSNAIYRWISQPISVITGILPFSLAEVSVISLVLFCVWRLAVTVIKIRKEPAKRGRVLFNFVVNALVLASIIYFAFIALWGLNYHREPFSKIAGLDVQPASKEELVKVCEDIIHRANDLRSKMGEDSRGYMKFPGGYRAILAQADKGYAEAARIYPQLGGVYGHPKPVLLSKAMSMTGIWGVFFPITEEANVNVAIPDSMKPSTTCHEMAHQRGFAREDEANYIATLTCSMHPSVEFQYSGVLLSLIHITNAIYDHDRSEYKRLYATFSDGVKRDWKEMDEFNKATEGVVSDISNKINDTYLKANMQAEGVVSYGRMVDLLIAEHRMKSGKQQGN